MRTQAGVVLIDDNKIALIEHYRDGKYCFVFPDSVANGGDIPEQAVVREMEEETGLPVTVPNHENVYPVDVAESFANFVNGNWPEEPIVVIELPKKTVDCE